ncbi:hypothetical protein MSG28_013522 [Choristoneura fumiferana]|uniref:Uncharacterized protein n=1 Tax=Choristoneura fumiferana TaxID=7141 RepID=A0ACC0K7Z8_CHOFU|nr:hypothetical protein MSG28_013522 [Choristoneura fumiferana]
MAHKNYHACRYLGRILLGVLGLLVIIASFMVIVGIRSPIYVPLLGTGLLSEQEGLGLSSHAGPVRIGNFARTIELLRSLKSVPQHEPAGVIEAKYIKHSYSCWGVLRHRLRAIGASARASRSGIIIVYLTYILNIGFKHSCWLVTRHRLQTNIGKDLLTFIAFLVMISALMLLIGVFKRKGVMSNIIHYGKQYTMGLFHHPLISVNWRPDGLVFRLQQAHESQKKSTTGSEKPLLRRIRQETQRVIEIIFFQLEVKFTRKAFQVIFNMFVCIEIDVKTVVLLRNQVQKAL